MNDDSSRLGSALFAISLAGRLLLIGMGLFFACDHAQAAKAYGIPVSGGLDNVWITAAAVRDLALGG